MKYGYTLTAAERLLQELGVTEQGEIDVDAIALCVGVRVKIANLEGCEAQIIGYGNRAIVTVRSSTHPLRRRFSVAHELGHWHHHRGRSFVCRSDDIGNQRQGSSEAERIADAYAADLLMPRYLFHPLANNVKRPSFDTIRDLASKFNTSLPATAIRLVDMNIAPVVLICHGKNGRKWFKRAKDIPERWFPQKDLDADSFAFDTLFSGNIEQSPRKIGAEAWFDNYEADRYDIIEHTVRLSENEVLTLLLLDDSKMLEDTDCFRGRTKW